MSSSPLCTFGRLAALCACPLLLSACQGEKKPAEARTAQGEILSGSASDAMLPLNTVRSQPPLAPEAIATGKPGKADGRDDASADASEAASESTGTPVAASAPSPTPSSAPQSVP